MKSFKGYEVLITAGASGIGRAITESFLEQGARVHVLDIDQHALLCMGESLDPGATCRLTQADVADPCAVAAAFENQSALDVLVNCAGIKGPTGPVESLDLTDWRQCIAVNLDATFLCCKQAIPLLRRSSHGSIISLSSTAGWHGYPLRAPYAAAKWGVIGLTKSLAMELGPAGIRVNAICPGSVSGPRMDQVISDEALEKGMPEADVREAYTRAVSLRTFIDADDIADTALFLASPAARRITGQAISVDGHLESFASLNN